MANEQDQERTLPATPQRLEKAREEGRTPRSAELAAAGVLLSVTGALWMGGPTWFESARRLVGSGLRLQREDIFSTRSLTERLLSMSIDGILLAAPIVAVAAIAAIAGTLAVGGWMFTTSAMEPKAERLSPMAAFERVFSLTGMGEIAKTIVKSLFFAGVAGWFVWNHRAQAASLAATALPAAMASTGQMVIGVLGTLALVAIVIAAIDVPLAIWKYHSGLKMTLEEIKRESRESEGDPHVKGRIRQQQREMSRRRMMSEVPKADVVITNPTHYAVALSYRDGEMGAPRIVAKGTDKVALRIREIAAEAGVPILEAPPLARALHGNADVGDDIPVALYGAVAQVLAWVFELRRVRVAGGAYPNAPTALEVPAELDPATEIRK